MLLTMLFTFMGFLEHFVRGIPVQDLGDFRPHIVGGEAAPLHYAPHTMGLVFGTQVKNVMCGASIVSEYHVLTAAHCVDALVWEINTLMPSLRGVYGSNDWRSTEKNAEFSRYINHPEWDIMEVKNDIGVLFLSEKLSSSDKWAIIPLSYDIVEPREKASVTGWGTLWEWGPHPNKLQLMYLETISHEECETAAKKAAKNSQWDPIIDETIELCTMHPKGAGFGMCHGDSGSALVSLDSNKQIGVVSWGFPCANGAPDVFARVSGFKDFLLNILSKKPTDSIVE